MKFDQNLAQQVQDLHSFGTRLSLVSDRVRDLVSAAERSDPYDAAREMEGTVPRLPDVHDPEMKEFRSVLFRLAALSIIHQTRMSHYLSPRCLRFVEELHTLVQDENYRVPAQSKSGKTVSNLNVALVSPAELKALPASRQSVEAILPQLMESEAKIRAHEVLGEGHAFAIQLLDDYPVYFTPAHRFDPVLAASGFARRVPAEFEEYLGEIKANTCILKNANNLCYQNTIKTPGWSEQLYRFVVSYLKGDGASLQEELGIVDVQLLSPRQAVELSVRLVADLTRYESQLIHLGLDNYRDHSTVMDILAEGLVQKENPDWKGNAICRHIAQCVAAVFESLKEHQHGANYLRNVYCVQDTGLYGDGYNFAQVIKTEAGEMVSEFGHRWNTFVAFGLGGAVVTTVDPTWTDRYRKERTIERLDHTELRSQRLADHLFKTSQGEHGRTSVFQGSLTEYYHHFFVGRAAGEALPELSRLYFLRKGLESFERAGVQVNAGYLDAALELAGGHARYIRRIDVDRLWRISPADLRGKLAPVLLKLAEDRIERADSILDWAELALHFKEQELQERLLAVVSFSSNFTRLAEADPGFRCWLRQRMPGTLPPFDPIRREEDFTELMHLAQKPERHRYGSLSYFMHMEKCIEWLRTLSEAPALSLRERRQMRVMLNSPAAGTVRAAHRGKQVPKELIARLDAIRREVTEYPGSSEELDTVLALELRKYEVEHDLAQQCNQERRIELARALSQFLAMKNTRAALGELAQCNAYPIITADDLGFSNSRLQRLEGLLKFAVNRVSELYYPREFAQQEKRFQNRYREALQYEFGCEVKFVMREAQQAIVTGTLPTLSVQIERLKAKIDEDPARESSGDDRERLGFLELCEEMIRQARHVEQSEAGLVEHIDAVLQSGFKLQTIHYYSITESSYRILSLIHSLFSRRKAMHELDKDKVN